ncbi:kinesin-like protein CG14535 isoform X3 [Periplaneta americana]|uniref:kinesin-like protein CG14535 isoform X3 n=1 Tax=Periplaneta americana TaxID=6978 RepID=UPI0037E7A562
MEPTANKETSTSSTRAAQKLNLTSSPHRRKRHSSGEDDGGTGFSAALRRAPPPVPPALLRRIGVKEVTGVGKVKVMLRVCGPSGAGAASATASTPDAPAPAPASFFSVDSRKKQVTLFDPAACGGTAAPEDRRVGVAAPKMFAFDAIFTQDDSQTEVCSSALTDVIHAVINGTDGCLFCFGHARLGKTYTMVGSPDAAGSLGVIPCAISWLFRGINEQKQKTGARFSVRVSAVEVQQTGGGAAQQLKDLLAGHANDCEQSPGVYLRDDPLFGTQLQNQSELRVPSAERAAFYLDAAVGGRSGDSHLLYTLHVYQYSVAGKGHGVAGGRSRLHLIDLGSCERGKASGGIPLSGLGNVLLAIFNGQKHLPHREHKITQLLKECLSSLTCHAAMIAHVSPAAQHYTDTLATVQLASRIHRMRRRKIKLLQFGGGSAGSGGSSGEEASAGAGRLQENGRSTGSSDVDPSSSEQSADTVIYVGPSDDAATDGEHPPVYIPSLNSGDNRCAMGKALRGSGAEHRPPSKGTQASPVHRPAASKSASPSKASPARTPSKTAPHKTPAVDASKTSVPSGSDEQWIDGPRISRSKVAEARSLLKKKETWVDGPLLPSTAATTTAAAGTGQGAGTGSGSGSYGFMDSHKKSMIRRWVENQTVQIQRQAAKHTTRPPATGAPPGHTYKELTVFKTCDEDGEPKALDDTDTPAQETPEQRQESRPQSEQGEEEEEEGVCDIPPPLQLLQPHNNEISIVDSLDVRLRILQERRDATGVGGDDEVEIIEVEEPCEPVPMQDSCLQVTEEDIALCMGELENPLPEVDQESDEHPLRVLSQENLTVVSTFTDSMSVVTDLERMLPRRPFGPPDPRPYSLYDDYLRQREADKFEQLARLHEMYKTKLARANATKTFGPSLPYRPPSRCQSLSMSDMLYGTGTGIGAGTGTGSIYSEPAYNPHQNQAKICDNCKMSFGRSWYQPLLTRELPATLCDSVNHRFCRSGCNLSSLRHPDGASNPNLKEEVERVPGNGASTSDHEDETSEQRSKSRQTVQEEVRTVTGQAHDEDEEDEAPPVLPPALPPAPASTRLHRRLFGGKTRPQHPAMAPEGYDSGHDSGSPSPRPAKASCVSGLLAGRRPAVQCESSGYESVVRDSECSSFDSSQDSDPGEPHDPGGSKKVPVLQYCREDVERLERRWTEAQGRRIRELRAQQQELKQELAAAKTRLLIPSSRWSYELHVEASMDCRHPSFLEALDRETQILRKRVEACKSHILMVTCFDSLLKPRD